MRLNVFDGAGGVVAAADYRKRLIKIATLACAAAQSWYRLRAKVFEALQTTVQNGFDMRGKTPEFITEALLDSDADMEGRDYAGVKECINEWLAKNSGHRG